MSSEPLAFLWVAVLVVALLYSAVGHAGASGYIAAMTLFGMAPEVIKPTALTLNILVACLTSWQFVRAGHFSWSRFWPFAALSVPMAFLGGYWSLPTRTFQMLVGAVLVLSAARLLTRPPQDGETASPGQATAIAVGGGIGLISGLTGTGGGIFLTPLLLFRRWATTRVASGISAVFILVNSLAGLLGLLSSGRSIPPAALTLVAAAAVGGSIGSYLGSQRLPQATIKRLLALVLLIAGLKLIAS